MNSLIETLNHWGGRIPDFAWPILWQSSVLIVVLFIFDLVARRKVRASVRYALWLVVLVKLLLPPTLALPTSLAWWVRPPAPPQKAQGRTTAFVVTYGDFVPANLPTRAPPVFAPPPKPSLSGAGRTAATWAVVGVGLLAWLGVRWRKVAGDVRKAMVAPEALNEVLDEAQHGIKLPRRVRLLVTKRAMSPAVCGLFRPVILLPQSLLERLTPSQLRAVLLHELAHLRRGDVWVNCVQALLQILYWWHPLLWLANARIRSVREEAVDDAVMLALADDRETYAPTLLEVAKLAFNRPLASLGLVGILESRSALRQRIERLVDFRPPRAAGVSLVSTLCTITFAAFALPMGERSINSVASTADELATQTDNHSNPVATTNFTGPLELSGTKPDSAVQYNHTTGMATVSNGAWVSCNGIILTANSVSVDLLSRIIEADGHVRIARGYNPIGNWVAEHMRLTSEGGTVTAEGSGLTVGGVANTSVRNFRMNLYAPLSNETISATQVSTQKQTESATPPRLGVSNTNEEVKLRMIVLNKPVAGDAAQIRKLAEDIIAKVKAGTAFSEMASIYSEGRQGREGGDWGWVQKHDRDGALVLRKELADVAFSLKPGELSGIIETPEVIYLMLVEDKRPAHVGEARYNEAQRRRGQDSGTRALADIQAKATNGTNATLPLPASTNQIASESSNRLDQLSVKAIKDKIPVLVGDIPLVGKLFRSESNSFSAEAFGTSNSTTESAGRSGLAAASTAPLPFSSQPEQLKIRNSQVDPNTFYNGLALAKSPVTQTNVTAAMRDLVATLGVDLSPPKSIVWNDRSGVLLVRATKQDLDVIESAMEVLNRVPPRINIKARFVELPQEGGFDWYFESLYTNLALPRLSVSRFQGVLTDPQFRVVLRALKERKGVNLLAGPEVTTVSGRQAQIQIVEMKTVVTGINPLPQVGRGGVSINGGTNLLLQTQVMPFGPVLEVIPYVAADGYTIDMTVIPSVSEFLGYDDPSAYGFTDSTVPYQRVLPLPRFRVRQITADASVRDGQTLVLVNPTATETFKKPDGRMESKDVSNTQKKQLIVFITVTLVDEAGNRIHSDDGAPPVRK